jgi:hypothetical protein
VARRHNVAARVQKVLGTWRPWEESGEEATEGAVQAVGLKWLGGVMFEKQNTTLTGRAATLHKENQRLLITMCYT